MDGCQQDHQRAVVTNRAQAQKKRWTKKRRPADNLEYDSESEALFEGITAWMRGWKDIDEGFRVRERERELRREERAKLWLEDVDANGDEESGLQHRTNFHFLMQVIPKIHDPLQKKKLTFFFFPPFSTRHNKLRNAKHETPS